MKLIGPDNYTLTVRDGTASVNSSNGKPHFVHPATAKKKPKLYVISKNGKLLYAGVTKRPMATRLRDGSTADGSHGYHGYTWLKKDDVLLLHVWYLDYSAETAKNLETIEAEVVFLFRHKSGQWPSEQTEIHFHESNELHKAFAKTILNKVGEF